MVKRFLISEEEKRQIRSLYSSKGILLEITDPESNSEVVKYYYLPPYYLSVLNKQISIVKANKDNKGNITSFTDIGVSANGDISNLKYNLETMQFESPNMWAMSGEKSSFTRNEENLTEAILYDFLSNNTFEVENELGYFVGINETNSNPQLFAVKGQILPLSNKGESPKKIVTTPLIGGVETFSPQNKSDLESVKPFISKLTFRDTQNRTVQATHTDYSSMDFKEFKKSYTLGISLKKGPEGLNTPLLLTGTTTGDTTTPEFIPLEIGAATSDPFNYDSNTLSGEGEKLLENFAKQFTDKKTNNPDLYESYLKWLSDKKITVKAYSSRDADPNAKQSGNFPQCVKSGQLKSEYNQCLSQKRAEYIVSELKRLLPDFSNINIEAVGMGETDKFNGKGWTKNYQPSKEETLPNRRFEVEFPTFQKQYEKK